jgi:anti-sigma-K factor RskA
MDKRIDGLAGTMREIAEHRDNQLGDSRAISADRMEQLRAFLAAELPVETVLFAAARQRDKSLSLPEPALPAVVHAALVEQVRSAQAKAKSFDVLGRVAAWLKAPSWPEPYRTALIATAAVVVTSAILHFSQSRGDRPAQVSRALPNSIANLEAAFSSDSADLSLRVRRVELASLEPSLLTINGALPRFEQPDRALPLELPIRQIRLDVEALRTP